MVFKGKALWIRTTCLGFHPPALWTESRFLLLLQKRQPVVNQLSRIQSLVKLQPPKTLDSPSKSSISPNVPEVLDLSAASPLWRTPPFHPPGRKWLPETRKMPRATFQTFSWSLILPFFTFEAQGGSSIPVSEDFHWSPVFSRKQSKSET